MQRFQSRKGFTLVEMLILIVVIAILALIVIPRLMTAGRRAKEASLKVNLLQLRGAIQKFHADCGDYPVALDQLMKKPEQGSVSADNVEYATAKWQGPYLRTPDGEVPRDPFWDGMTTPEKIVSGQEIGGWDYNPRTGEVHSASTLPAIEGSKYSDW